MSYLTPQGQSGIELCLIVLLVVFVVFVKACQLFRPLSLVYPRICNHYSTRIPYHFVPNPRNLLFR